MNKYILFLVFAISGTLSYGMDQDQARELKERELHDKYFRKLCDTRFDMLRAYERGDDKTGKKLQREYIKIKEAGWDGQSSGWSFSKLFSSK